MLEAGWLQILQRLTVDNLDNVSLVTVTGTELVVQNVYRIEQDFLVARARTSGTLDSGRVVILPYGQIDFLAFNKKMGEDDVQKILGGEFQSFAPVAMMAASVAPVATPLPVRAPLPPRAPVEPEPAPVAAETVAADSTKANHISKTLLLARLRERLAEKSK